MPRTTRACTDEFKRKAVRLVKQPGAKVTNIARRPRHRATASRKSLQCGCTAPHWGNPPSATGTTSRNWMRWRPCAVPTSDDGGVLGHAPPSGRSDLRLAAI